jgi:glycosyltransferase involved in cell wall biosynthesis
VLLVSAGTVNMEACVVIPAYQARRSLPGVLGDLRATGVTAPILVVDDGSTDGTAEVATGEGVTLVRHGSNRGKGAALRTGFRAALARGFRTAVTVDADGQHPAASALAMLTARAPVGALVLGVRDLVGAGAPRPNRISNRISNAFLSCFSGRTLHDTQCGLRRYPVPETLELGARADGYAFEAEIILRALAAGLPVHELPIEVYYPPESERVTHFHSVRDPARIVATVVATVVGTRLFARANAR